MKLVEDGLSDDECLVMSKNSKVDQKFSITVGDCNKKHSVVCRLEPQKINPLTRPGKFPCMTKNRVGRRKRSADENQNKKTVEGENM